MIMYSSGSEKAGWLTSREANIDTPTTIKLTFNLPQSGSIRVFIIDTSLREEIISIGPTDTTPDAEDTKTACLPVGQYSIGIFGSVVEHGEIHILKVEIGALNCSLTPKLISKSIQIT